MEGLSDFGRMRLAAIRATAWSAWKGHQRYAWLLFGVLGFVGLVFTGIGVRFLKLQAMFGVLGFAALLNILIFCYAHRIVVFLMQCEEPMGEVRVRLERIFQELLPQSGLTAMPKYYIARRMEDPNAFAFGSGIRGAYGVAVTQGILDLLDDAELSSVLAHELGHLRARDTTLITMVSVLLSVVNRVLGHFRKVGRVAWGVALILEGAMYIPRVVASGVAQLREFAADAFSVFCIGSPTALIRAFEKLEAWQKAHADQKADWWFAWRSMDELLLTHPGMDVRKKFLQELADTQEVRMGRRLWTWWEENTIPQWLREVLVGLSLVFSVFVVGYFPAPVITHTYIFEGVIRNWYGEVLTVLGLVVGGILTRKYAHAGSWKRTMPIVLSCLFVPMILSTVVSWVLRGVVEYQLYRDAAFLEVDTKPRVSSHLVRYTPERVAVEEILRRTQTSEFTPGTVRAIGTPHGVAYIAPLVPQGVVSTFVEHNAGFMYFDDGGTEEDQPRVTMIRTEPFVFGEGMEVLDDIHRRLITEIGFFKSYPEISYVPVRSNGRVVEIIGVVPYIDYRLAWGLFIPEWGGVVLFHASGQLERLTPQEAIADPRLRAAHRLFPEELARRYVEAQRYDQGVLSGWYRRGGKIEVPQLPAGEQMPYFLPMEDGTYQYLTMVEPDGDAYSLMRVYMVHALTGERTYYRHDREDRDQNLQGPAKVLSYAKQIPGYNWYEESGSGASGSYRLVESRPVTRSDRLYYMLSITPVDYARVVGTVFVDAETNAVIGPFGDRASTFAWLAGEVVVPPEPQKNVEPFCAALQTTCAQIVHLCPAAAMVPEREHGERDGPALAQP
ncbi:M48 family metalloprotease [Candidatus Uhrbacteria bacterium]|nr:M48 family metalloprotease [Candidatus Uhrbacteria bacterium]